VAGPSRNLVSTTPSEASIAGLDSFHFLDNDLGDYAAILADYTAQRSALGYTIYGQVTNESGYACVQYWFFYAYNDHSVNQHEGDWEMIEVILNTAGNPIMAAYSQHFMGESANWSDVETTDNTHPNVYVAKGSHANYFRPYEGKLGLASDEVGNDGFQLAHDNGDLSLVLLTTQP